MRSASGSKSILTIPTSQIPVAEVRNLIRWLKDTPPDSPALRNVTNDEIWEAFVSENYRMLMRPPRSDEEINSTEISGGKFNQLARCQLAQMSKDGQFLSVPNDQGSIKGIKKDSIFIRQAYKDHWDIIYDHFVVRKSRDRVMISGTPGCGKSVEGIYLLHKIFTTFSDNPPPILYSQSDNSKQALAYVRGFIFFIPDYRTWEGTVSHSIMDAFGPIWHIYDSTAPQNYNGGHEVGPQILICSPARSEAPDLKSIRKGSRLLLYLPLPTLDEMHLIRRMYHNDPSAPETYVSERRMIALITKWGCVPRTVFEVGKDLVHLEENESKVRNARDVERLIHMVGSSQINHYVASGMFLHIVPIPIVDAGDLDDSSNPPSTSQNVEKGKRKAEEANIDEVGLSPAQRIEDLKSRYTRVVYTWASDHIRDCAFEAFLTLGNDRMIPLIVNYHQAVLGGFRGLILEPFVHKLLSGTGVIGRMKNLDSGKRMGSVKFGPWRRKNLYQNHSQLVDSEGIINVPLKGNEADVDSLVPYDGYCFQITGGSYHGINRPALDTLMSTGIFDGFLKRQKKSNKNISFVFIVEAGRYDEFKRQDYHSTNKRAYAENSPLRRSYPGVTQYAFEIDLRRIFKYEEHQKKMKVIDMTDKKTTAKIEKAVQRTRFI